MDQGARQAIVHGVERVRHDLVTKPPPPYITQENKRTFTVNYQENDVITCQLTSGKLHCTPIIQSEVSQKEKHKYSILTHIYGI